MNMPRSRGPGSSHAISCTDGQWAAIRAGAARARKRVSPWFVECALTVDPLPMDAAAPPLILNATEQRFVSRAVGDLAAGARSTGDEASPPEDDIGALLEDGIRAMVQRRGIGKATELLRTVFGDERAEVIAAAFIPDRTRTPGRGKRPGKAEAEEAPGRTAPPQGELF